MNDQLPLFNAIVREHAPSFLTPITWYSNGQRGHLHATDRCDKIRRHGVVTRDLRIAEALEHHVVCSDCISYGRFTPEQNATIRVARSLRDIETNRGWQRQGSFGGYPAIVNLGLRLHYETLIGEVNGLGDGHGLDRWVRRVGEQLANGTPCMPERDELDRQALLWAAPRVLLRLFQAGKLPRYFWGHGNSAEILDVASAHESSYRIPKSPLVVYTRTWLEQVANGLDPRAVTAKFLDDGDFIGLLETPDQQQMQRCEVVLQAEKDESLWSFARRNWSHQVLEALREATVSMLACYDSLVAPAGKMVLANHSWGSMALRQQLVGGSYDTGLASTQETVGTHERSLILCHPTVAQYVTLTQSYNQWSEPLPVDDNTSTEVLETALALWEPRDNASIYHKFNAALAAAKVI